MFGATGKPLSNEIQVNDSSGGQQQATSVAIAPNGNILIVWQSTAECENVEPFTLGIRLTGQNGGETRASVSADGVALDAGDVSDLPVVIEFDPASFVLTAMGRINGGTLRGDSALADRFCNLFFRI